MAIFLEVIVLFHQLSFSDTHSKKAIILFNNTKALTIGVSVAQMQQAHGRGVSTQNLITYFKNLPSNVTNIHLGKLWLQTIASEELSQVLAALFNRITALQFEFHQQTSMGIGIEIDPVAVATSTLDMDDCELWRVPVDELIKFVSAIPPNVLQVSMKNNALGRLGAAFKRLMQAFRAHVIYLDLSANELYLLKSELSPAINAVHPGLVDLELDENELCSLPIPDFLNLLQNPPPKLNHLGLRGNQLYRLGYSNLHNLFSNLGPSIHSIHIGDNMLYFYDASNALNLICSFPPTLNNIIIDIELDSQLLLGKVYKTMKLKNRIKAIMDLVARRIHHDFTLFSDQIAPIVQFLEASNAVFFQFLIGLLLSCRIVITSVDRSLLGNVNYKEMKLHTAIDFYVLAAQNAVLRTWVDLLLWKIKTKTKIESVQKRLDAFAIPRPEPGIRILAGLSHKAPRPFFMPIPNENHLWSPKEEEDGICLRTALLMGSLCNDID